VWLVISGAYPQLKTVVLPGFICVWGEGVRNRLEVIDATTHGMTSQKKSSYGHFCRFPSFPFFFLGAHLRVASTHYFNPDSVEIVGLIYYCTYLLCYYYMDFFIKNIYC